MVELAYILVGHYKNQSVFYCPKENQVYIEKDHQYLVIPNVAERKGLLDEGLVKIINDMLEEGKL